MTGFCRICKLDAVLDVKVRRRGGGGREGSL